MKVKVDMQNKFGEVKTFEHENTNIAIMYAIDACHEYGVDVCVYVENVFAPNGRSILYMEKA